MSEPREKDRAQVQTFGFFSPLPPGSISPQGWLGDWAGVIAGSWLLEYATHQDPAVYGKLWNRNGSGTVAFTAKDETIGPPDYSAYFADGFLRFARLSPRSELAAEVEDWLKQALASQDDDGYLGAFEKEGRWQHWLEIFSQSLMLEALLYRYEVSGDREILSTCERAAGAQIAAWQSFDGPGIFGLHGTYTIRAMGKLYELTGDGRYLDFAREVLGKYGKVQAYLHPPRKSFYTTSEDALAGEHIVMETEHIGLPAMLYEYTGEPELLEASKAAWEMLRRFHLGVTGTPHGNEPMWRVGPRESSEHCGAVEWIITSGALARITGEVKYADEVERAIYNAYPAAKSPDGRTLGYMHAPNQLTAAEWGSSTFYDNLEGCVRQHYHSAHEPLCCNANSSRGLAHTLDALAARRGDDLAILYYGPCRVKALLPGAGEVELRIETDYPFEDNVDIIVIPQQSASFALHLRIPGWCASASILVNSETLPIEPVPGSYVEARREWSQGDRISLHFENPVKLLKWRQSEFGIRAAGVVFQRGPLTYALPVKEDWQKFTPPASAPVQAPGHEPTSYRIFPVKDAAAPCTGWNYAVCVDFDHPEESAIPMRLPGKPGAHPWEYPTVGLQVEARRALNWCMEGDAEHPATPGLPYQPVKLSDEVEKIILVPFGFTHLRMTYLPVVQGVRGDC